MKYFVSSTVALLILAAGTNVTGQDKSTPQDKVTAALPETAPAKPKQARKILIFLRTAGFRHSSIGIGAKAIAMMGDKTVHTPRSTPRMSRSSHPEKLKAFDAVFMLNTTGDCLRPKGGNPAEAKDLEETYKKSLADFVAGGKGLIGVHSATDTYGGWKDYNKMMGGAFDGHPWHEKVPIKNLDPRAPSTPRSTARISRSLTKSTSSAATPPCRRIARSCSAWIRRSWT